MGVALVEDANMETASVAIAPLALALAVTATTVGAVVEIVTFKAVLPDHVHSKGRAMGAHSAVALVETVTTGMETQDPQ